MNALLATAKAPTPWRATPNLKKKLKNILPTFVTKSTSEDL